MGDLRFIKECVTHENAWQIFRQCDDDTIVDFVLCDPELNVPKGYAIQMSATKENHFARPYPPGPGAPFLASDIDKPFVPKEEWDYDFCYMGSVDTKVRKDFFNRFEKYLSKRPNLKTKIVLFEGHFLKKGREEQDSLNDKNEYADTIRNSKFALCPTGHGLQSIRFYEALSMDTIPIWIASSATWQNRTKLPLDWIIDWQRACFKLPIYDISIGTADAFDDFFDKLANIDIGKINEMREYIHNIYREYLMENEESREKFRNLVVDKINEMRGLR